MKRTLAIALLLMALSGCALEDMLSSFVPSSTPSSSDVDYYRRTGREP